MSDFETLRSDAQKWIDTVKFPAAPVQLQELAISMYIAARLDHQKIITERDQDLTYCVEALTKLLKIVAVPTDVNTMQEINTVVKGVMNRVHNHG